MHPRKGLPVLKYEYDDPEHPGGVDISVTFTSEQLAALGADAGLFLDWTETALWALVALRTGVWGAGLESQGPINDKGWYTIINDLDHRLLCRLQGIRDAAIRAHAGSGGSIGNLALAMDVPRSTAQSRRDAVLSREPDMWETWARKGGPQEPTSD